MEITNYYDRRNTNSQQVDIRDMYFRPLHKYSIREAHLNRDVHLRYDPYYYSGAVYRDTSVSSYGTREHNTYEITFDQLGLDKLTTVLSKIEEEWLRKNNPSLQKAWEHYQTVLGLVK